MRYIRATVLAFLAALVVASISAAPVYPVRHSPNQRYLVDQTGAPFPIMGRTAWFVTSLSVADYQIFVDDTAARGYSAIELHVINHDPRGNHPPLNGNNDAPFLNTIGGSSWNGALSYVDVNTQAPDFTTPNPAYWSVVDSLLAYCESKGLLVFMFPAYVGAGGGNQGWMGEMVANGPARMQSYGAWIANRYKNQKNLVWMAGGDMGWFTTAQSNVESALLTGLASVAGQQSVELSAEWTTDMIATDQTQFGYLMTLNSSYSWYSGTVIQGRRAYGHSPTLPAFMLEEPYDEEGPDGNNYNPSATQPVRRFQWWGWLSTIGGYVSGNGYVWPFNPGWKTHLNTQGAQDMARLNAFMRSIAWYNLVPSGLGGMRTLITVGGGSESGNNYVTAAATPDGSSLVAYVPPAHTGSITVDMAALGGPARARWFDPTSGAYVDAGTGLANTGQRTFTPPGVNSAGENDWVLDLAAPLEPDTSAPTAPAGLGATAASSSRISLTWTAASDNVGVTGYRVERCQGAGCSSFVQIATPAIATSFDDTGLFAGTSYGYRVRATDAAGNLGSYSNVSSATTQALDTIAPTAPVGLSATALSASQINLAWTAASDNVGVTGYRVERCQGAGCSSFVQIATPAIATSFDDTGLIAGTSYGYRVRATDAAGNLGSYSGVASATTSITPPGMAAAYSFGEGAGTIVADVSGNNNTGNVSGTTWTTAGQFGNALVFNGTSAFVNLGNPATLQLTGSMTISAWIKSAAFPVDDAALVSTRNGGNLGYQLDTTKDTGPRTIGFKLTHATGSNMARYGATAMQLNQWYYVTGVYDAAAQTLNVYLNGTLDNGTLLGPVSATQQASLMNVNIGRRTGLSGFSFNGTIDEPRIYGRALTRAEIQADMATAVGGGSPPPDTTPPGVPAGLGATAASASQINLAWAAASDNVGVTGYRVERCQGAGCSTFVQIATTTTTGFGDAGLIAETSYSYRVRAADAAGNLGAYSSISSATTTQASDATAPSVPTGLGATAVGSTQINLAWTASTDNVGVTDYRVERCKGAGCSTFVQIATATTTSFNNTGLRRGTSYSYRVRAADAAGNLSAYSSVASATTSKRSPQEGDGAFLRTTFRESLPAFSRDGRWLAYSSDESGPNELYVRPFPGPGGESQVNIRMEPSDRAAACPRRR